MKAKAGYIELGNLYGPEGNAFVIMGRAQLALKDANRSKGEINAWMARAKAGSYADLLQLVLDTFTVGGRSKLQASNLIAMHAKRIEP